MKNQGAQETGGKHKPPLEQREPILYLLEKKEGEGSDSGEAGPMIVKERKM